MPYFTILAEKHSKAHPSRGQSLEESTFLTQPFLEEKSTVSNTCHLIPKKQECCKYSQSNTVRRSKEAQDKVNAS